MFKQSLLSSTLVLGQAADGSGQNRPVFGLPFRFGKPLIFSTPGCTANEARCAAAQQSMHTDAGRPKHLSESCGGVVLQHYQQRHDCSTDTRCAPTVNASYSAASQFYLSSLGVALAQGCASPAAAAAAADATAAQATCRTTAQFAAASILCAVKASHDVNRRCRPAVLGTASKQLNAEAQHSTATNIAGNMAPAAAAAALSNGYPVCKVLESLQRRIKLCRQECQTTHVGSSRQMMLGTVGGDAQISSTAKGAKRKSCESGDDAKHQKDDTPGPGFYSVPDGFGRQGVAFSMGAKLLAAPNKGAEDLPGPGTYHCPRLSSAAGPAFTLGSRWKQPGQDVAAPGPGEHQQTMFVADGPSFSMYARPEKAAQALGGTGPGPGAYAPDWDRSCNSSGPAYTLGGRTPQPTAKQRSSSPGPAAYQNADFRPEGPAFSFPAQRKLKRSRAADTPAPTDYDTGSVNIMGKSAPAYSIAAKHGSQVDQMFKELFPGPGAYHAPDTAAAGPAFSMGSKLSSHKTEAEAAQKPAPGDYHRELPKRGHAFSITGRPASPAAKQDDDLAGPGTYYNPAAEAALQSRKAFTIGMKFAAGHGERAPGTDSPGPASYNAPIDKAGPAYSIGGKPAATDKDSDGPGPASYGVKPVIPEGPAFSMGARIVERHKADNDAGPAVGEYDVAGTNGMAVGGPAWTIGVKGATASKTGLEDAPGPGYYVLEPSGPSGPAWSIAGRGSDKQLSQEDSDAGPGPGEYHCKTLGGSAGPAFTIAARVEVPGHTMNVPGPGAYLAVNYAQPSAADAPAFTIGSRASQTTEQAAGPGPGAFELPELSRGPCYSIAGRVRADDVDRTSSPGPAAYSVVAAAAAAAGSTPAWTMGEKPQDKKSDSALIPAPGDYDPVNSSAAAAPAWTISCKPTKNGIPEEQLLPGPGYYTPFDVVKESQGAAFTIGSRRAQKASGEADELPAPGAYNLPEGPGGVAYTIAGKLPQSDASATAALPAPGQYHKPSQPGADTPAYTIAVRVAGPSTGAEDQPGPGTYEQLDPTVTMMAAAPAFTMAGRPASSVGVAVADGPGAGQYEAHLVDVGPSAPAFTIAGKLALNSKVPDGPGCVDYDTQTGQARITRAAPAFTMGAKLVGTSAVHNSDVPAPGCYHSPATEGAPPHKPAAPAYSIQGKHKKGKSKLKQMLGKLADIDHSTPGPGEHQPSTGGIASQSGPAFSFAPAAAAVAAAGSSSVEPASVQQQQQQALVQLQAQLAKLLTKKSKDTVRSVTAGMATPAAAAAAASGCSAAVPAGSKQQLGGAPAGKGARLGSAAAAGQTGSTKAAHIQPPLPLLQQQETIGQGLDEVSAASLAAIRGAVANALQASSARRRLKSSTGGDSGSSKGDRLKAAIDYTTPAPGDHGAASRGLGASGPAYTMAGKLRSSTPVSLKEATARLAAANGSTEVCAAAAAVERLAGTPGVGTYKVERGFPYPEGQLLYKPILKNVNASSSNGVSGALSSRSSDVVQMHSSSGQLSRTRRVSWADQPS